MSNRIGVWSYLDEYYEEKLDILAAVERVFCSGKLILGSEVLEFEKEFASYCGVDYAVGVNSGTDAIFLALKALGLGVGDDVLTVSNTAVPTVSAIVSAGCTPRFVDICKESYTIDVAQIKSRLTPRTKALVVVHLYGQCCNMADISLLANDLGLFVIEDCAQSHGAMHKGEVAGSMSDIGCYSFYPTKILGCYGDGGMIITKSKDIYDTVKRLRFYGMNQTYYSDVHGYNSRLDELQAAILRVKLKNLDTYCIKRRKIAQTYDSMLDFSTLKKPVTLNNNIHSYYLYVVRHPDRDQILSKLSDMQIDLNVSYPYPIHQMPAYLAFDQGVSLPETEAAATEIFSLPMYPSLTNANQLKVINELNRILKELK